MSKGSSGGTVVIEEEIEDEKGRVTKQLNNSVKSIDLKGRIVVKEGFYEVNEDEDEDETSNMSMAVDDVDSKQQSGQFDITSINNNDKFGGRTINFDESGSEALDLSFIPCSIPLKKRKISSLPNSNTQNEERVKSDYHHNHHHHSQQQPPLQHRQHNQFHHKIVTKDSITTIPSTSAFNQLTNNHLNSFSLQSNHNHFPFSLRVIPSATSSSSSPSSSISNCKPLSLVKNQIQQLNPHLSPHHQPQIHQHHTHHQQLNQHQHHHYQHQKFLQYQQQQLRLQDFTVGNKSTIVGSSTSGQTKGMSCRRPGFITCSICNATKYYSHVQRRFGQYSCEPCSKFMKRFLRDPKIFTCSQKGHCTIGKPSGEQEPRGVSVNRCKACWLKICLEKFILDSETRLAIDKYYAPKFSDSSGSTLVTEGGVGGDGESEGGSEFSNNLSTSSGNSSGLSGGTGGGSIGEDCGGGREESKDVNRLRGGDIGGSVEGEGGIRKPSNQSSLPDRIEANGCDTTISPPPLPFPQRKRKPKNETSTPSTSSSSLSSSTSSSSTQVTTTTTTPGNLMNNGSTVSGESIPLTTSLSGNSRIKDKQNPSHQHHHPLHHSQQNQQYAPSFYGGVHPPSTALGGHLLTEPLCLTTGRRSDLSSSGLLGNLSSNSRSSYFPGGHLSLSQASLGPRYPWSHRRKDDYDLLTPSTTTTSLTTPITFRRELIRPSHHDNLINRRGSDDDLNDLYSGDYSLTSPELLLSGPYVGVSHIIKDSNGDGDDNVTVMGSPATPPPPPARCGKCTYCLPKIDEKANVVVVKENVGPVRCRLAEMMSKISQSNEKGGGTNEDSEGQNTEDGVHSSTPTLNNIDNNKNNGRRSRKERRGQSKGVTGGGREGVILDKEECESGIATTTTVSSEDIMMNDDENDDREVLVKGGGGGSRGGDIFYRKRLISEDGDDQSVSAKYPNHDENHRGHHHNNYYNNYHQGNRSLSTSSSTSSSSTTKLNKSGLFNAKPYKKILINEHFVNSSATINNQSTSNSINSNNPLSSRDLSGPVISPDSNFLSEILNANSPFL